MAARKIPTVPQRALANALERRREAAGLSREDVSSSLEWSSMKLLADRDLAGRPYRPATSGSWPCSTSWTTPTPRRWSSWPGRPDGPAGGKACPSRCPKGSRVHLELESAARAIRTYEAQFVPGLWQTEDYARAVLSARSVSSTPDQIERQITIRMRRQQILDRASPPPPEIWAVLDESVIRRAVGGRDVMRAPARTARRDIREHHGHAAGAAVLRRRPHGRLRQSSACSTPGSRRSRSPLQHRPPRRVP